ARCTKCHSGFNFTDEKFHNIGTGWDDNKVDLGRYMVTKNAEDISAFKTPTLREIARSAPYMHDGRFKTLEDVVNFYNQGGVKNPHQDPLILPLELTKEEKHDLVQFLRTLNGEGYKHATAPTSFPQKKGNAGAAFLLTQHKKSPRTAVPTITVGPPSWRFR